jgi:hypothetical protein
MSDFDDREKAFEKKFAHDEELAFRATARRNKLLGLWAARLLGFDAAKAESYAKEVVVADFETAGDEDVVKKLMTDLGDRTTEKEVRTQLADLYKEAVRQVSE